MAAKYCTDKALRVWNLGHDDFCNETPAKCRYLVKIGKQEYCGYCPARVALHQVIRGQAGCIWCKHSTKNLDCKRCAECLGAPTRINFDDGKE